MRMRMSSSMRWRNGVTVGVRNSMVLLLLKYEADGLGNNIGRTTVPDTQVGIGGALPRERLGPLADSVRSTSHQVADIRCAGRAVHGQPRRRRAGLK